MHRLFALVLIAASLSFAEPPKQRKTEDRDEVKPSKTAGMQCPPVLDVPKAWQACVIDSDCTLAGDACRTCGNFLPVNARYKTEATQLDASANVKAKCVRACEACSLEVKVTCRAKMCSVVSKNR